tara:strand:- start:33071 stop:33424 length:354 start_codon:yes stop_codon:yes gene_type:complete
MSPFFEDIIMQFYAYLLLNAVVVLAAIWLSWHSVKKLSSFVTFLCALATRVYQAFQSSYQANPSDTKSGATRVSTRIVAQDSRDADSETKILTSFLESVDYSDYESPAYLRKGILVH